MASLRDRNRRHDAFFRKARSEGFAARSVYKLEELDRRLHLLRAGARVLVADIFALSDQELLCGQAAFDVVLSDMAPDTTGIRATDQARSAALVEEALGRAERLLAPLGVFVAKIFQSPEVARIRARMSKRFSEVRLLKPESSRGESTELYLVGKGFLP